MRNKKLNINIVTGLIISIVLLYILLKNMDINLFIDSFSDISIIFIIISFIFYLVSILFKAYRFKTLLKIELGILEMFKIVSIHNLFNILLPARIGELSYILLLKKGKNVKVPKSLATLIIARIFDLVIIFLLLIISTMIITSKSLLIKNKVNIIIFFILSIFILFILTIVFREKISLFLVKLLKGFKIEQNRFSVLIIKKFKELLESLSDMEFSTLISVFLSSFLIWLSLFVAFYYILLAFSFKIEPTFVIFSYLFLMGSNILPLPSIGGFGTSEGAWAIALIAFGVSKDIAIITGFLVHIMHIAYSFPIGLISIYSFKNRNKIRIKGLIS